MDIVLDGVSAITLLVMVLAAWVVFGGAFGRSSGMHRGEPEDYPEFPEDDLEFWSEGHDPR